MKDWNKLIADKTIWMNRHYTPGRSSRLRAIVLHHNAGNLTTEDCYRVWQTREASAHYQVEANGVIGQLVHDRDTAWHAGNWGANCTSIGIEHANNQLAPAWTISNATLENGAHLVAAICAVYQLGIPTWGVNVFPHQHFVSTGCPGAIAGSQREHYMARARDFYAEMTGKKHENIITRKDGEMLLLVDKSGWFQTQGPYARYIGSPELLNKMGKVLPVLEISSQELKDNWIILQDDHIRQAARVREIKDMLTDYPSMNSGVKATSVLRKIEEKLGIQPRTN